MNFAYMDKPTLYGSGNAIQYMHYLPYGEEWIDQQSTSWNAPYTFTGKIKDAETGYNYFGARYYDSKLSVWLSVDPMSDKYPSLSPYTYCANNPIMMVDPDGRHIWVVGDDGVKYLYKDGYLWNKLGEQYIPPKGSFEDKIWGDLKVMSKCKNIKTSWRLSNLERSNKDHTIEKNDDNFTEPIDSKNASVEGKGSGTKIFINVNTKNESTLAHELLGHAHDNDGGFRNKGYTNGTWGISLNEINAVNVENCIREYLGTTKRTTINGKDQNDNVIEMTIPSEYLDNYFIDEKK